MYLEYYSLDRPPFRITPDPSLFFTGGANGRGVVLEALLYAVTSGEGILKVVGEVGSGKTMLCRMLEERLPDSVEVVYLANPNLSAQDILYAIAFELKIAMDESTQRLVLMQRLQEYLLKQHAANRTVLVIIEEAQSMPIETLEEVRLFSNLETHQHKLMQIVLFGQPELDKNLQSKSIRQLRERITHSFNLRPLTQDETSDYIRFRLQAAGCPCPQVFSDAAEKMIGKASDGLTRRINILADKSMLAAYAESATALRPRNIDNQLMPTVLPRHVKAAIKDSGYENSAWTFPRFAALASAMVAVVTVAGFWWQMNNEVAPVAAVEMDTVVIATVNTDPVVTEVFHELLAETEEVSAPIEENSGELINDSAETAHTATAVFSEPADTLIMEDDAATPVAMTEIESVNISAAISVPLTSSVPVTLLESRSGATTEWLRTVAPDSYIVQLLSVGSEESRYVITILQRLEQAGIIDQTYACLADSEGKPFWKVVYGSFERVEQAREFIASLPANIRSNTPFVQNIARLECDFSLEASQVAKEDVRL